MVVVVVVGLTAYILVHNYHIVHTRVVSCKSRITVTRQRRTHTHTDTYPIPELPAHRPPSTSLVHYHHHSFSHQTLHIAQLATYRKKGGHDPAMQEQSGAPEHRAPYSSHRPPKMPRLGRRRRRRRPPLSVERRCVRT
ncbi:hypothetical protein IWX46DRAFT_604163, partial [Phyllosticta citricarpa]